MQVTDNTLATDVAWGDYPSRTWYIDHATGRLSEMCDGYDAVKQSVEILLSIERYKYQIFTPNVGIETEGLIGRDAGFVESELKRRISEALSIDSRISGTRDFVFKRNNDGAVIGASFIVDTVYGAIIGEAESA